MNFGDCVTSAMLFCPNEFQFGHNAHERAFTMEQ